MSNLNVIVPQLALVSATAFAFSRSKVGSSSAPTLLPRSYRLSTTAMLGMVPMLAQAQAVDLRRATESGNAIIMYLCGTLAAVGIVAAGVNMMRGNTGTAKVAFVGALICGLAFAIVRTMWSNMGLEAAGVGTFSP